MPLASLWATKTSTLHKSMWCLQVEGNTEQQNAEIMLCIIIIL